MKRSLFLATILFALPLVTLPLADFAGASSSSSAQDVEELLRARALGAATLSTEAIWQEAAALDGVLLELEDEGADPAIDRLLRKPESLGERGVLLLAALRLGGDAPDYTLLLAALKPLFTSADQEVRRSAAGLFIDPDFTELDADDAEDLIEALLEGAKDLDNEPQTRLAFAISAHRRGGGAAQRDARKVMLGYLQSAESSRRALGALALAEIKDLETARPELERMSRQPGAEGRLAEAYLRNERLKDFYETRLRTQRQKLKDAESRRDQDEPPPEDFKMIERVIATIEARHIEGDLIKREDLIDSALDGMLRSLDQHSAYMNREDYTKFQQDLSGEYGGIGAYVNVDPSDSLFTITRPIYSGPAYKADLRTDDKILQIDDWPTHNHGISKDQDEIIRRLKGKPGTDVKLYIWRRGMDPELIDRPTEDMAVTVTRGFITVPAVQSEMLPGKVGLVELSTFSGVATASVGRALNELLEDGAEAIVLDLRSNPGGLLNEAAGVTDLFLPKGKRVVTTEHRIDDPEEIDTRMGALVGEEVPVVVLINRFSASASEIVAGALQDHGRATLVGGRSFGKGSVQNLIPMANDDKYEDQNGNRSRDNWEPLTRDYNKNGEYDFAPRAKLTVARYLLPSGRSIHRELDEEGNIVTLGGISPDFVQRVKRWDTWRLEALLELQSGGTIRNWVEDNFVQNRELFTQLAYDDGKDPSRYPGFAELYQGLDTVAPEEDVRFLIRREVRRRVQDERGAAFPRGDYEEDLQLQKAIDVALEGLGRSYREIDSYRDTFEISDDLTGRELSHVGPRAGQDQSKDVRDALGLIAEARREDGKISEEGLAKLQELLSTLDR